MGRQSGIWQMWYISDIGTEQPPGQLIPSGTSYSNTPWHAIDDANSY
jgi:hypothetical protein